MHNADSIAIPPDTAHGAPPLDSALDLFGMTHVGLAREQNQDHFLLATVHPQLVVHGTSLPETNVLSLPGQRLATVLLVADGVGGSVDGSEASRLATEEVMRYLTSTLRCYHTVGTMNDHHFMDALRHAALDAHKTVRAEAEERHYSGDMATTLSLGIVVWPWLYVVQVGDSRCYCYSDGALRQITRDQTIAQDLVDRGVLTPERAQASPLSHVLSSAIGASEASPEVTRVDIKGPGTVILVCSDGLTKHVSDAELAESLAQMTSSEQLCRSLLALVLERGASDNVTLVVGRALSGATP
jgi:protein phosphatase